MLVSLILCDKGQNIKQRLLSTLLLRYVFIVLTAHKASDALLDFGGGWECSAHRKNQSQMLQAHQDEVLLPDGQAAEPCCLQVYSGSGCCTFHQITKTGKALPKQSLYSGEHCAETDGH